MTVLLQPENYSRQSVHTDCQRRFYREKTQDVNNDIDWAHLKKTSVDHTRPQPVLFHWETDEPTSLFELSESRAFYQPRQIHTERKTLAVENLKVEQEYWWRVNGSESRCFVTDGTPRWIYAEGATNIRDNGGWHTADGNRLRQGMLFRGSELEWQSYHDRDASAEDGHTAVTEAGKQVLLQELGIKTDLDLRISAQGYLTESPLGAQVRLQVIPLLPYYHLWEEGQPELVRQIFSLLADPAAYPIYYHCWGGIDRTGSVALLLEGLLGVSEEDMLLDYELSSLGSLGTRSRKAEYFVRFLEKLTAYAPEGSWQERCRLFLLDCGVTREDMQQIRRLLLEQTAADE